MQAYPNLGGNSNVKGYEVAPDQSWIRVKFGDGSTYTYTLASCGKAHLDRMIKFARAGIGLNSYVTRIVKKQYASKE